MAQGTANQSTVDDHLHINGNSSALKLPLRPKATSTAGKNMHKTAAANYDLNNRSNRVIGYDQASHENQKPAQELIVFTKPESHKTEVSTPKLQSPRTPRLHALDNGRVPFLDLRYSAMLTPILAPQEGKPVDQELNLNAPKKSGGISLW